MSTYKSDKEVEREFDNKFCSLYGVNVHDYTGQTIMASTPSNEIKSFISTLRKEDREALVKDIEGMKKENTREHILATYGEGHKEYNNALSDIINLIRGK